MMRSALGVVLLPVVAAAAWAASEPVVKLPPKLRAALVAEMVGVKDGMAEVGAALAGGEWDKAARGAERIRDSYIMRQKLSRAELEELERALPADFAAMDGAFHGHAEGLAHAAAAGNYELAVFYYGKMMDACGSCHARYATHRFPGFQRGAPAAHGH